MRGKSNLKHSICREVNHLTSLGWEIQGVWCLNTQFSLNGIKNLSLYIQCYGKPPKQIIPPFSSLFYPLNSLFALSFPSLLCEMKQGSCRHAKTEKDSYTLFHNPNSVRQCKRQVFLFQVFSNRWELHVNLMCIGERNAMWASKQGDRGGCYRRRTGAGLNICI